MSTLQHLRFGERVRLGSHAFSAEEIKSFAAQHDPLPFHVNEEAAASSIFGGLAASGWHGCVWWMRLVLEERGKLLKALQEKGEPLPQFGPSPGFRDLRFIRPVMAGDVLTFWETFVSLTPHPRRAGWHLLESIGEAWNQKDEKVMEFNPTVLIYLPEEE